HFVVFVERSDVPGYIGGDAGHEFGQATELIVRIVEAGDQQRNDFQPETHAVKTADGFEDRTKSTAKLVVVTIVEALEIYFVQLNPGTKVFQHLGRAVAVGNKSRNQTCRFGFFEYRDCPLAGNQRLVVRADKHLRPLTERILN